MGRTLRRCKLTTFLPGLTLQRLASSLSNSTPNGSISWSLSGFKPVPLGRRLHPRFRDRDIDPLSATFSKGIDEIGLSTLRANPSDRYYVHRAALVHLGFNALQSHLSSDVILYLFNIDDTIHKKAEHVNKMCSPDGWQQGSLLVGGRNGTARVDRTKSAGRPWLQGQGTLILGNSRWTPLRSTEHGVRRSTGCGGLSRSFSQPPITRHISAILLAW